MVAEETMSEFEKVRVLIADDHPLVVGGLREAVLAAIPGAEIAVAHDFESMASALESSPETDLVLLDLTMPGVRGFSGLLFLRSERPSTPIIVVSGNEIARSSAIASNSGRLASSRNPRRSKRCGTRSCRCSTADDGLRPTSIQTLNQTRNRAHSRDGWLR
jgi:CheY-like chemotaxis protein